MPRKCATNSSPNRRLVEGRGLWAKLSATYRVPEVGRVKIESDVKTRCEKCFTTLETRIYRLISAPWLGRKRVQILCDRCHP